MKVNLVFDIGKTNKKCILFDKSSKVVHRISTRFAENKDEDGFPCDDLQAIVNWIDKSIHQFLQDKRYKVNSVNFSTYGASFVHIDENGKVLTPLYNYLKPYPPKILKAFYKKHGKAKDIARTTASPPEGMLNSGLQLFWIKRTKPKLFKKIKWSLHFPQYLSFIYTRKACSEYTSIGCHTGLWDYQKKDYHQWVYDEKINRILAPVTQTNSFIKVRFNNYPKKIKVGMGIHDSSAAILPYFQRTKEDFILLSTGTWNVLLNPFNQKSLKKSDLENGYLNYMRLDGHPVRASRLLMGKEHEWQVKKIAKHFKVKKHFSKHIRFDKTVIKKLSVPFKARFSFEYIENLNYNLKKTEFEKFNSATEAYYQLILELAMIQAKRIRLLSEKQSIRKMYIEGGFVQNKIFLKMLKKELSNFKIKISKHGSAPALGTALLTNSKKQNAAFI